jgi:hypothetical protein
MTKYYHGGKAGLPTGGYVLPASETGHDQRYKWLQKVYGDFDATRYDMAEVYMTSDVNWATAYAAEPNGWVYEVEPVGAIEMDPDEDVLGMSWKCSRARILSRVHIPSRRWRHLREMLRE